MPSSKEGNRKTCCQCGSPLATALGWIVVIEYPCQVSGPGRMPRSVRIMCSYLHKCYITFNSSFVFSTRFSYCRSYCIWSAQLHKGDKRNFFSEFYGKQDGGTDNVVANEGSSHEWPLPVGSARPPVISDWTKSIDSTLLKALCCSL